MFIAAQYVDDMINDKGLTVFIHSSNGHTRATTIALIYMCLFKKHSGNLQELAKILKSQYGLSQPNLKAAEKILQQRKDFQEQIIRHEEQKILEDKKRAREEAEEAVRLARAVEVRADSLIGLNENLQTLEKLRNAPITQISLDDDRHEKNMRLQKLAEEAERLQRKKTHDFADECVNISSGEKLFPSDSDTIKFYQEDTTKDSRPVMNLAQMNDSDLQEFMLEAKCNEMFSKAPYKFKPKSKNPMELEIAR